MKLLTAALQAYVAYTNLKLRRYIDDLEDEIDKLASVGDAASVLRIERLSKRIKREQLRSSGDNSDWWPALYISRGFDDR